MIKTTSRFLFFFFLIFHLNTFSFAQAEASKWYFGNGAGISFSNSAATFTGGGQITSTTTGCASMSDVNGNLLFYTDGTTIWNQNHAVMPNGTGLMGNSAAQSAIIIKKPQSTNLYYVFTVQGANGSGGFKYNVVDMSLSGGTGSVTIKNAAIYTGSCTPKMTATKHCNGTDYWIVVCGTNSNFRSYLLTATGVNTTAVLSSIGTFSAPACMKISPNGKKIAYNIQFVWPFGGGGVYTHFLADFDNNTGLISNQYALTNNPPYAAAYSNPLYGCEFSPDGTKLYMEFAQFIGQFDLCHLGTPSNPFLIGILNEGENPNSYFYSSKGTFQLARDGKIYVAETYTNFAGAINNPNDSPPLCVFQPSAVSLGSLSCGWGLPNYESSIFEKRRTLITYTSSSNSCLSMNFSPPYTCTNTGYVMLSTFWDFGDPISTNNTSTLNFPSHVFSSAGNYSVQLIVNYDCNKSDTIIQTVFINAPSLAITGPTAACSLVNTGVTASGGSSSYSYTWSPGSMSTAIVNSLSTGIYTVTVLDNTNGCSSSITTSIQSTLLQLIPSGSAPLCFNGNNGTAGVQVNAGSGSYTYSWAPGGQTTSSLSQISPGIYTVTVFDIQRQCAKSETIGINPANQIIVQTQASQSFACTNKSINLYAQAYGGTNTFTYNWSSGGTSNTQSLTSPIAGTFIYTVNAQDSNACLSSTTIAVTFFSTPTIVVTSATVCSGQPYSLVAFGANNYTWMPGFMQTPSISGFGTSSKIFTVVGQDNGCSSNSTGSLTVFTLPTVSFAVNSPICNGQILQFSSNITGIYFWSGANGFSSSNSNPTITANTNASGIYSLTVTDANGCSNTQSKQIIVNPLPILSVSGRTNICVGESLLLIASGASSYTWNNGASYGTFISASPIVNTSFTLNGASIYGCESQTVVTVLAGKCTGLTQRERISKLRLFPNPSNGIYNLITIEAGTLEVFDALGKLIYSDRFQNGENQIDLSHFPNGIYLLNVRQANETNRFKLIKNDD